ncbi:MAG: integrase arm-type DNA-binding domain-containing protein [Rhodomicrobium sp.]
MKLNIKGLDALQPNGRDVVYWDDDVTGFGIRVKPSGVKSFIVQYRTAQGRSRKFTIGQYGIWAPEQARVEAKRLLRLVDQGVDPVQTAQEQWRAITIAQLCDEYMQAAHAGMVATRSGKRKKASTLHQDESRISAHIKPLLGDTLVKDLSQAQTRRFFEDIVRGKTGKVQATGKPRGKSNVRGGLIAGKRSVGLLGGMITYAVRLGYRQEGPNPAHDIGMPADTRREFRLDVEGWRAYGTAINVGEQAGVAWQAVSIARLIAITGCRLDEITSLRWAEVDFPGCCLRFDAERVKTGPLRPIGRQALGILLALKARAETHRRDSLHVFPGTATGKDQAYLGLRKAWSRFGFDFTPHSLRHAFASVAEDDCGLHESTVAAIIGHQKRSGNTTRSYVHKDDATLLAAADKVCGWIWQAITGGEIENGN